MSKIGYKNYKSKHQKSHNHENNNIDQNINEIEFIFNSNKNDEKKEPEWMKPETKNIKDINKRFHAEIIDYVNYITPNDESLTLRQKTFELFKNIVQKYKPDWKVYLIGSFSQNLSTLYSDLDFLILFVNKNSSPENELKEMYNLMNILKQENFCKNIRLAKARVPVIRAECFDTGINVDISINMENGLQAVEEVQKVLAKYKILRPSIMFLKILLQKFNLNDPHSGGMSSFLLFHLIYYFFIHKLKEKNINIESNNKAKIEEENNKISNNEDIIDSKQSKINNKENNEEKEEYNSDKDKKESCKEEKDNIINNNYREDKKYKYEGNIGNFIMLFLKFYGYEFDYKKYSICLYLYGNNFAKLFLKDERKDMECSNTISVEKIIEKGNDAGFSCYKYPIIVKLFQAAYNFIKSEKEKNICSLLLSLGFPSI